MALLVDTSFWFALLDPADRNHSPARSLAGRLRRGELGRAVTSDFVLNELANLMSRGWGTQKGADGVARLLDSDVETVFVNRSLFAEGLEVLRRDGRPRFSLTDAVTVALARSRSIETVATFDREFDRYVKRVPAG
ncbi:MAG: type II toxin-antitoxin system VapC family toxin [Euryarchaeota archaeon]|nr:type II toxin-antitoxin system VapC family toxin [Euryarchaeota archaeon]